ncbi:MAG TPA: response regulator, partial [Thermoanaerobaculia bacterium]|nr:response regulator [Thermoanaerobaculia bacterium]
FTTRAGVGASGLGLATVATIVEQAGGRVEVESQVGQGSSFHVFLPAAAGRKKGRSRPAAASVAVKGERILLVDDNRDLAAAVLSHLSELGYRVRSVDSAEAALAAASEASEPFDLVVTDVLLRGAPGTELVDRLRSVHPIRALYMSGYTDRIALRRDSTHAEAFFLKKPFSVEGLARMVRELLDAPAAGSTAAEAGPGMDTMAP